MSFVNECEECGAEYHASPRGRDTWFILCPPCFVKDQGSQPDTDNHDE